MAKVSGDDLLIVLQRIEDGQPAVGLSTYRTLDGQPAGVVVKAGAGRVRGYYLFNSAAAARYVKLYDKATTPASTDTPVRTLGLPAGAAANIALPAGLVFAVGIGLRVTTLPADNDTTAPAAGDVIVNLDYV